MKITVRAFAQFREVVGEVTVLDLPQRSGLPVLFAALASRSDESRGMLFDDQGAIREHVIFMVNRKRVPRSSLDSIILYEGDEVAIYPPVAGG
ncbi:MAG: MoaD/ThiS family protein [Methanomicrobiales archaeon]|nr:MoaD/ThiS family protein [Methanomicrobiales archaeon]